MGDPENFRATDDLKTLLGYQVKAFVASEKDIQTALERYFPEGDQESITELIGELASDEDLALFKDRGDSIDLAELKEMAELNPVKKLLNLVLLQAIKEKASDIHFEPFDDEFKMRYRIDGVLYEMVPPPRFVALAIASRIKVMANLDISERRLPQDGRIELRLRGLPIDLRVSVLPTMFGESVVLRVLDRSNVQLSLDKLGFRFFSFVPLLSPSILPTLTTTSLFRILTFGRSFHADHQPLVLELNLHRNTFRRRVEPMGRRCAKFAGRQLSRFLPAFDDLSKATEKIGLYKILAAVLQKLPRQLRLGGKLRDPQIERDQKLVAQLELRHRGAATNAGHRKFTF